MSNTDISISQAIAPKLVSPKAFSPIYLVQVKSFSGKGYDNFIAVKCDKTQSYVDCVGFICKEAIGIIPIKYEELVQNTPKNDYIEVSFPWSEIKQIRSLVYRHR